MFGDVFRRRERYLPKTRRDNHNPGRAVSKLIEGCWPNLIAWRCYLFLAVAAVMIAQITLAAAASDAADPMTTLLEEARANGLRVIIIDPGAESLEPGAAEADTGIGKKVTDLTGRLVQRFGEVIDAALRSPSAHVMSKPSLASTVQFHQP